ncbi:MAG: pyrimidine reductase [Clostridiaceae bacterium]|nr:pyrimidine reductase [Clostridiaceae bacterium]
MTLNKLATFSFEKTDGGIRPLYENKQLLAELAAEASQPISLEDVTRYYGEVVLPDAPNDRPYIFSSIVVSADGKMAFENDPVGPHIAQNNYLDPLGGRYDFWVLNFLRAYSDAVIMGGNTMQNERESTSHIYDRDLAKQRQEQLSMSEHPCSVIVSYDATDIPFDHLIFNIEESERYKVLIATSPVGAEYIKENSPLNHSFWTIEKDTDLCTLDGLDNLFCNFREFPVLVTGEDSKTDIRIMMKALRRIGIKKAMIESPTFCAALMHEQMMDEYFINYSMLFAGGRWTPGYALPFASEDHPHSRLVSIGIHEENFLFTRQKLIYNV